MDNSMEDNCLQKKHNYYRVEKTHKMKQLNKTVNRGNIIQLFEYLWNIYSGKSPDIPKYYFKNDIPKIMEIHSKLKPDTLPTFEFDYAIRYKSSESTEDKLRRHLCNCNQSKFVCNDWMGLCVLVEDYSVIPIEVIVDKYFAELSHQDNNGYSAIHAYLYDAYKCPIEVQFHSKYDHIFNIWNRNYNYKKIGAYGYELRELYDRGKILSAEDYKKALLKLVETPSSQELVVI